MKKRKSKIKIIALILISVFIVLNLINQNSTQKENNIQSETTTEQPKIEENIIKEKRMSLVAVGDALIHNGVYLDASLGNGNYDFTKMFTEIEPLIKNYDLKYYNQETIIGGKNLGLSNYPRFNSPDEIGLDLIKIGFNMVSLANNHALDKNEQGVLYSVNFWNNTNIVTNGQNRSLEDRENKIKIYEQNGIKYAFLAYTNSTNGITAPSGKEYLVNVYSDNQAYEDINKIKNDVDVIIVAMHWGDEYSHVPNDLQKQQAKYLSSLGVDLIIGSHPHVIQPVGYVDNTLVIYSLGNFISAQKSLGLAKIIGLMVGLEIVVNNDVVTFENLDYNLLYTYCTSNYKNFKIIPFNNLTDDILFNNEKIEEEYLNIVKSEVNYD